MPASPFTPFDTQYSAQVHVSPPHPITGVVYITAQFKPNNQGGFNCRIYELRPPYTGKPVIIRDWVAGQYSVGPFGHGASVPLPTGALLTVVPVAADSAEVRPSLYVDPGVGPAFALGGGQGAKGDTGATGAQGPAGPKGDPGPGSDPAALEAVQRQLDQQATTIAGIELALGNIGQEGGALTPDQASALEWVVALRRLLTS